MNIKHLISRDVYVYFAYETDDFDQFGNYHDAKSWNNDSNGTIHLCGYLVNESYGTNECILAKNLYGKKPTYSEVKSFILACYDCVA